MMEFTDYGNVHEMLVDTVEANRDRDAYRWILDSGVTEGVTWAQFHDEVRTVAKALIAHDIGPGDTACILSYTCFRWVLTDVAMASIGSCAVGIYQSLLADGCRYIADHCEAGLVFAENREQLDKLREVREQIPRVKKVVLFNGTPPEGDDWVMTFEDFVESGRAVGDDTLDERIGAVGPEDVATVVYTSGTTGIPKGAILTHDNLTFTAQSVHGSVQSLDGDVTLLFLPLAHVFARTCVFTALEAGATTVFARSLDTIADDLKIARPHWFASVPRVYEKVFNKIIAGAEAKGGVALALFRWSCRVGDRVSDCLLEKRPVPLLTRLQYAVATKLVFSKVQQAVGGRVRWCISGAAPLNPTIAKFFHAAGILILEGIGMTENTSFTNLNRYDNYRFGWVGPTGPGIEQKVADDGEVLYRGRNVMRGYLKMPAETAETLTEDGWQHTGDLGEIDADGFLKITGRKKDLIITAGGKNVAPAAIEGLIATSKYIAQVCVVGDRRKFLTALVTVDPDTIMDYAREHGIAGETASELIGDERIVALIEAEVEAKNHELASFETIKALRLVEEFTIANDMLTPTMKVKRNIVQERYADLIDSMYPAG
jgi:long-chain acyl-CoA synthetase